MKDDDHFMPSSGQRMSVGSLWDSFEPREAKDLELTEVLPVMLL